MGELSDISNKLSSMSIDNKPPHGRPTYSDIKKNSTNKYVNKSEEKVVKTKTRIYYRTKKDILTKASFGLLPSALTFWYLEAKWVSELDWRNNLIKLVTVTSKEQLWKIHNYLELASNLEVGSAYFVFKQGVLPDWADEENANGGRWVNFVHYKPQELNDRWQRLLAMLATSPSKLINGISVNKSKRCKGRSTLAVWVKTDDDVDELLKIYDCINHVMIHRIELKFHDHKTCNQLDKAHNNLRITHFMTRDIELKFHYVNTLI